MGDDEAKIRHHTECHKQHDAAWCKGDEGQADKRRHAANDEKADHCPLHTLAIEPEPKAIRGELDKAMQDHGLANRHDIHKQAEQDKPAQHAKHARNCGRQKACKNNNCEKQQAHKIAPARRS